MKWYLQKGEEVTIVGHLETVCVKMNSRGNLEIEYKLPRSGKGKIWCPAENREKIIDSKAAPS